MPALVTKMKYYLTNQFTMGILFKPVKGNVLEVCGPCVALRVTSWCTVTRGLCIFKIHFKWSSFLLSPHPEVGVCFFFVFGRW